MHLFYKSTYNRVNYRSVKESIAMSKTMEIYYFSPTGGTKKVTRIFVDAMEGEAKWYDLGKKAPLPEEAAAELTVFAAPVFGGRIPSVAREKMKKLNGAGKRAVTLAVYGNRAYEDALLEMNDLLTGNGFIVIASGAFVAQHSMDPEVSAGRPNQEDAKEIRDFANAVRNKKETTGVQVPGNHPYKSEMKVPCTPISRSACNRCGACVKVCPTEAISMTAKGIATDKEKCILCMACTSVCPQHARTLPPPVQGMMKLMLGKLKNVRNKNESFL